MKWENCLVLSLLMKWDVLTYLFTPFVDNGVIIIWRNMIAISRFHSLSFFVELCWIAFKTLQTETGKKLKRNCNCCIQFSSLRNCQNKISLIVLTLYAVVCWKIIKFFITRLHLCAWKIFFCRYLQLSAPNAFHINLVQA